MSKLKLGVVGCGGIANQKHFPALKNNADLNEIVAFCDIKVERAEKAAKEFGAPGARVYADYKELLADPEVEGSMASDPGPCQGKGREDRYRELPYVVHERRVAGRPEPDDLSC